MAPTTVNINPLDHDRVTELGLDRAYVFMTARHSTVETLGGKQANRWAINAMVDKVLEASDIDLATFPGESEIMGFVAFEKAESHPVEFLYLRASLFDADRARYLKRMTRSDDNAEASAAHAGLANEFRVASDVIKALLKGQTRIILRRPAPWAVMQVLPIAGVTALVTPRAI